MQQYAKNVCTVKQTHNKIPNLANRKMFKFLKQVSFISISIIKYVNNDSYSLFHFTYLVLSI